MSEGSRRLATVETIESIRPIPNADAIECARVRGWDVVVKVGEFVPGDRCVYFEIDTFLDTTLPEFAFLAAHGVRTDADGRRGHALRTMKLRGQVSQGLIMPLSTWPLIIAAVDKVNMAEGRSTIIGADLTDELTMGLWEPPISASLSGKVRGHRPSWISKTDEERLQNIPDILNHRDRSWAATEKVDGTSVTFYHDGTTFGCCSRNLDLLETDDNSIWKVARELGIEERLSSIIDPTRMWNPYQRVAIQGEIFGEGIQKNPLKISGLRFAAFNYIVNGNGWSWNFWPNWLIVQSVPTLDLPFPTTLEEALEQANGLRSRYCDTTAEGIVWADRGGKDVLLASGYVNPSFKVISNNYLIKHND